jgi:hypothetical protein
MLGKQTIKGIKSKLCSVGMCVLLLGTIGMGFVRSAEAKTDNTGDWSSWQYLTDLVSVSYNQVEHDVWTWKFRNESNSTTITYMSFKYWDEDGEHSDVLPVRLEPGEVFGGWAAFTASSRPTIAITEIERE